MFYSAQCTSSSWIMATCRWFTSWWAWVRTVFGSIHSWNRHTTSQENANQIQGIQFSTCLKTQDQRNLTHLFAVLSCSAERFHLSCFRFSCSPTKADFIRAKYQFLSFVAKPKDSEVTSTDDLSKVGTVCFRTRIPVETAIKFTYCDTECFSDVLQLCLCFSNYTQVFEQET